MKLEAIFPQPKSLGFTQAPTLPLDSCMPTQMGYRGLCALHGGALVEREDTQRKAGGGGPPEDDIRGTYGDLRERTHQVSSSSFFEVPLWFEFNFDFLNFSRLKLK